MYSQCISTGANAHGYELDESKGNSLCIGGSEARRCDWTRIPISIHYAGSLEVSTLSCIMRNTQLESGVNILI